MSKELEQILTLTAEAVFEALAFLIPMPEEEEAPFSPTVAAQVAFSGPFDGALTMAAESSMLPALAANMLGTEEGIVPSQDQQEDAFKELLNVLCGNLLPVLAGRQSVFKVHAPQLLSGGVLPETAEGRGPVWTTSMCVDAGRVRLALFAHGELPAELASAS